MSNGGYKGATPPRETSPEHYPGVWELTEQFQAQADGNWPFQETDCAPKSLKFDGDNDEYLSRTPIASGNQRVWTWSSWVKLQKVAYQNLFSNLTGNTNGLYVYFNSDGKLYFSDYNLTGGAGLNTTRVFRDHAGWMSLHIIYNTPAANPSDRVKIFINGVQETLAGTFPNQDLNGWWNNTQTHFIGRQSDNVNNYNLYAQLSEINFIDGQALSCNEFGFFDEVGIWQPKRFTGDYSNGPVYSNFLTGGIDSSYPAPNGFDGVTSGIGVRTSANGTMVWQPSAPIGFNNSFKIYCSLDGTSYGNTFTVTHAGGTTDFTSSVATGTTNTAVDLALISGVTSPITKITVASGGSNPRFSAIELDGQILTDASVGRNSFHLDFSDAAKDQSGLGNDWAATNLTFSGTTVAESSKWESGDSDWSITAGGSNATKTTTSSYADVFTGKFEPGKLYAFTSTFPAGDSNGGWFFTDSNSTSLSGTHPNQGRGSNSIGQRGNNSDLGVHGSYATANGVSAGDSAINGFSDSDTYQGATINWVVDRVNHKVWAKTASGSSWIKGGDPTDPTSTPSFLIPSSGDIYFGVIQYDGITNLNLASYSLSQTITTGDDSVDSPVNGNEASSGAGSERRGNYCTLNPLYGELTLSNGNLHSTSPSGWKGSAGTIGMTSGKFYWEIDNVTGNEFMVGIIKSGIPTITWNTTYAYAAEIGYKYPAAGGVPYGAAWTTGDVIGVAFDADNGSLSFYKNGVSQGVAFTGLTDGPYLPSVVINGSSRSCSINFGQRVFQYQNAGTNRPSADYKPLATSFLPEPTIKKPDDAFDITLFDNSAQTSGSFTTTITPDLIITKRRTTSSNWILQDIVRGYGDYKNLHPNLDVGQTSTNNIMGVSDKTVSFGINDNMWDSQVAWYFDAGESTTTIAAGGLNSSAYDQSQNFTSNVSNPNGQYGNASNAFDGSLSTHASPSTGNEMTYTNPSASSYVISTFEIYIDIYASNVIVELNGTDIVPQLTTTEGWYTITGFAGQQFSTLKWGPNTSNLEAQLHAVRVNGKVLVDSGVSVANVPSIPTTVRARPETGFSICSYTGTEGGTFAHSLLKAPEFVIVKRTNTTAQWTIWHKAISNTEYLMFTSAAAQTFDVWGDTSPDSNVVTVSGDSYTGNLNDNYVAYCWTSVEGYSSIGSFQNPSSSDGAFVFCGFKPKLIIAKCVKNISSNSGSGDWMIYDTSRLPFNDPADNNHLVINVTNGEDAYYSSAQGAIDILSNGFKIRHPNSSPLGDPGRLYIYAAWAESPFASQARAR